MKKVMTLSTIFMLNIALSLMAFASCSKSDNVNNPPKEELPNPPDEEGGDDTNHDIIYDETGCKYTTVTGLVMAGYQGWFTAEGDGAMRGWRHYQKEGKFEPGYCSIDFWPDVSEYPVTYKTNFEFANGAPAYVFSSYDSETTDLHFKWMKEYNIDGVYMQRFVTEIKQESGERHFNEVLKNALEAANKYDRAICVMYDLSGTTSSDMNDIVNDWNKIVEEYSLFDNKKNPNYLRHNKKPLVALWGIGFSDGRKYTLSDIKQLISALKGEDNKVSIMLGVPYYWRTLNNDALSDPMLHDLIKKADVIMPWAVGRYDSGNYEAISKTQKDDIIWCQEHSVSYIPLVFPGFSWGNLKNLPDSYNEIPRSKGDFLWQQVAGAKRYGAKSLYVAMFDEVDEGTAIFKCMSEDEVPLNGDGKFVGIEEGLDSDYYLWLTGQATNWFHGQSGYSEKKPDRQ